MRTYTASKVGENEQEDLLHFGKSLMEIKRTPHQEIGSHTFSHFIAWRRAKRKAPQQNNQ